MIYFTSSWDDGSVYDIKLAELLLKFNQKATFFIPLFNVQNRDVINEKQIVDLSEKFEIGAHTVNHKYLTSISNEDAEFEIKNSKIKLETITEKPILGFCFPGGKYKPIHLQYVNEAHFKYVRTVNMFKLRNDSKIINTTLQAYDHSRYTYFKHLIKRNCYDELFQYSIPIFKNKKWDSLFYEIITGCLKNDSSDKITILHLWGHSWEIEENNNWKQLAGFLDFIEKMEIKSIFNYEIVKSIEAK